MSEEGKRMKIAYLTSMDPMDRRAWSGISYYAMQALQKHCGEVVYIGPTSPQEAIKKTLAMRIRTFLKSFASRDFVYDYQIYMAKKFAKTASAKLVNQQFDVIVVPTSITEIAHLKTDLPIVLLEDATFALLHNYYPLYSHLMQRTIRQLHTLTATAIKKASLLIYPSTWAARSATEDYAAHAQKLHVVPMGANFNTPPSREVLLQRKKSERCRLLFVGVDWERKGGEIAFETLLELEKMGIQAELTICGCTPPKQFFHERMRVIPFLDKHDAKQQQELFQLYLSSDFLLLPTRNECFGIVFCEANAFGLPAIATATGGVPEVIKDGENGYTLPSNARGQAYARLIADIYQDEQRYNALVESSRSAYENRLNWDTWGMTMHRLLTELLASERNYEVSTQVKGIIDIP